MDAYLGKEIEPLMFNYGKTLNGLDDGFTTQK